MPEHPVPQHLNNDTTFRSYTTSQAAEYASRRGGYPSALISALLAKHRSTGGQCTSLLDLGCGPGNSTRNLAVHFEHTVGLDPGERMIASAREIGGVTKTGKPIEFLQGEAEACEGIEDSSVDMITAATSGHWFDMQRFWPTADRIMKPGGTVAFFTIWRIWYHPFDAAEAEEIQEILMELEQGNALEGSLGPWLKEGNWLLMNLYEGLKMPWQLEQPCDAFPKEGYDRQVWNLDGRPSDAPEFQGDESKGYMCGVRTMKLDDAAKGIATGTAVTLWREAHPELAGTERDCVNEAFERIRKILRRKGGQGNVPEGEEMISLVGPTVLVTVKKE